ncbi:MAG: FAD-dependent thymidylate synthase [Acidobacteria bacterium]|nr:FAD-dependent thymidylate synthase [Acidobacteriota bacterium]
MITKFLSPEPEVKLEKSFADPFKTIITAARTCYSSKGIIKDQDLKQNYEELARSLYEAGHHTTLQHAYFQFSIANVSRQCIWSFLHSHPFYNSEQVSQRYVEVKPGSYAVPPLEGESLNIYQRLMDRQVEGYHRLAELLQPLVAREYYRRFPARRSKEKYGKDIPRKAQEVARYVLPVATFAYMYHTVSGITVLRYWRLCEQYDAPLEQRLVVEKMVQELLRADPDYAAILEAPLPLESTPEHDFFVQHREEVERRPRRAFLEEFDRSLEGRVSRLVDYKARNEQVLAQSVREVLGVTSDALSDPEAIDLVLHPGRNRLLGESLNLTTHSKLARTLFHPAYTFRKKISHTADSQDQRHRMTPASRPCLAAHASDEPDYITPELVRQDQRVRKFYDDLMTESWEAIGALRSRGVAEEFVLYALPNAVAIRFTESADLLNLHHKHAMRLCYNAQEEIWRASLEEALQIREINPLIGQYLLPPCSLRQMAAQRPICPEGPRYCGEPVWNYDLSAYQRII